MYCVAPGILPGFCISKNARHKRELVPKEPYRCCCRWFYDVRGGQGNQEEKTIEEAKVGQPGLSAPAKVALVVGSDPELESELFEILPEWKITCAGDSGSALEMLKDCAFGLVITGEETSANAGITLLREIRQMRPQTRLIILASDSTPVNVIEAMREHAFSYFSKPFSRETFRQMVHMATASSVWDDGIEVLSATPEWIQLCARCDENTADRVLQFIHEVVDVAAREREAIAMAFRELLMNAIEHGANFDSTQHVEISYVQTRRAVMCRLKDPGRGFAIEKLRHAAISNPPDNPVQHQEHRAAQGLRPGGFGILLAKKIVDDLIYGEKGNEVILVKYIKEEAIAESGEPSIE